MSSLRSLSCAIRRPLSKQTSCRRASQFFACDRHWHHNSSIRSISSQWQSTGYTRSLLTSPRPHRPFSTTSARQHGHLTPPKPGEERHVTFIDKEGQSHTFSVSDGDNLLDIAQAHDLEMEGACGGSCACSTCHVIITDPEYYDKLPEPDDDENDMLDLAFGLTETSRLGCQVKMSKEMDGLTVQLPSMTRNMQMSDFEERTKAEG